MSKPECSVIVAVAASDYAALHDQLRALRSQATSRPFEILVCDNSDAIDVRTLPNDTTVVPAGAVRGAGYARNCGATSAQGSKLLFCDADDLVSPTWVDELARGLDDHPLVGGAFLVADENSHTWRLAKAGEFPHEGFSTAIRHHEGVAYATSANMGIRAELFQAAGGFPTEYLRSQDVALSLQCRSMGHPATFAAGARVLKSQANRTVSTAYQQGLSRARLCASFGAPPTKTRLLIRTGRQVAGLTMDVFSARTATSFTRFAHGLAEAAGVFRGVARMIRRQVIESSLSGPVCSNAAI